MVCHVCLIIITTHLVQQMRTSISFSTQPRSTSITAHIRLAVVGRLQYDSKALEYCCIWPGTSSLCPKHSVFHPHDIKGSTSSNKKLFWLSRDLSPRFLRRTCATTQICLKQAARSMGFLSPTHSRLTRTQDADGFCHCACDRFRYMMHAHTTFLSQCEIRWRRSLASRICYGRGIQVVCRCEITPLPLSGSA